MLGAAQVKWINRFLQKSDIEAAIVDHNSRLEEASHSFQVFFLHAVIIFAILIVKYHETDGFAYRDPA